MLHQQSDFWTSIVFAAIILISLFICDPFSLLCGSNIAYSVRSNTIVLQLASDYTPKYQNGRILCSVFVFQAVHWLNESTGASADPTGTHLPHGCMHTPPVPPYRPVLVVCQVMSALLQAICQWRASHMWPSDVLWVLMWACGQILFTGLLH